MSGAAGVHELEALLRKAPDELSRHDVVLRALDVDIRAGARLAVAFLRADPPLFFRQEVVERLERAAGKPLGFDVTTAFRSPANQRAADTLTKALGLERPAEPR